MTTLALLLDHIAKTKTDNSSPRNLADIGITRQIVSEISQWAAQNAGHGRVASYIPGLAQADPTTLAIAMGGLSGDIIEVSSKDDIRVSIQSVVKPFLYLYALQSGTPADEISFCEATAVPFHTDRVMYPDSGKARPGHPLNNAGAISAAGAIDDFRGFLQMMQVLTGNERLDISPDIYKAEMKTNSNNRAIAYRLAATGRFASMRRAQKALCDYTKACAIAISPAEAATAALILASGGVKNGKRLFKQDYVVRTINAMNSYGLYEYTSEISLLASGVRALSCKSGVSGLIINVDPKRGAFCTYGAELDEAGNSVFGKAAIVPLNILLSAPNAMLLSASEITLSLTQ